MILFLYLMAIVASNIITAAFLPLRLGFISIPYGTWFIGATFVLRDLIQVKYGKKTAYLIIIFALIISAITSILLKQTLAITIASAISFFISESADTEIYSRFRASFLKRVFASGIVSSLLDSIIFVTIGLSPLISNFLPWNAIPGAITGQFLVKGLMQLVGIAIIYLAKQRWETFANEK